MAKRAPHRNTVAPWVWALSRVQAGQSSHLGVFTSADKGTTEAERLIKRETGLAVRATLRLEWQQDAGVYSLNYGRDAHDFRFRLEPWPLDGEA